MIAIRSIALLILTLTLIPAVVEADNVDFTTTMDCAQATTCTVPPCTGSGQGTFTLDTDTGEFSYNISYSNLSAPETVAHFHGPAAPGVPAGVAVSLPSGNPKIGSTTLTLNQQNDLLAELYYVNIHTGNCGGGEIRGQVLRVAATTTTTSTTDTTSTPSTSGTTTTTTLAPGICGDLDESGTIGATDALILLQKAVGIDIEVKCPDCPGLPASDTP